MESLEDRLAQAGHHEEFSKLVKKLKNKEISDQDMYDWLENHGASPEEADEMTNLLLESD